MKEALKLALEALHYCEALNRPVHEQKIHAIKAIKEALAQPEEQQSCDKRPWVGLTDEEINAAAACQSWKPFARAIEAKLKAVNGFLKEKNT